MYYKNYLKRLPRKTANVKRYLTLLETILNDKKSPVILPKIHNNNLINMFYEKADLSHTFVQDNIPHIC